MISAVAFRAPRSRVSSVSFRVSHCVDPSRGLSKATDYGGLLNNRRTRYERPLLESRAARADGSVRPARVSRRVAKNGSEFASYSAENDEPRKCTRMQEPGAERGGGSERERQFRALNSSEIRTRSHKAGEVREE